MSRREREADFSTGTVKDASFTLRPDAIAAVEARAPGPRALDNASEGLFVKGWYARPDNAAGKVYLGEAHDRRSRGWKAEAELFAYAGAPVDSISLTFDTAARPVVALERDGDVWLRFHNGAAYELTELAVGTSPVLLHQAPDSEAWGDIVLLYERASAIYYRLGSESYAQEYDTLYELAAETHLFKGIVDTLSRLHLILTVRDPATGEYSLERISSNFSPPCMDVTGDPDRIDDGIETLFVFREDGEITCTCELEVDLLAIGGGGDSGGDDGGDTTFWLDGDGFALDPDTDTPLDAYRARGGGGGGLAGLDGRSGASGGGGGARSPAQHLWTAGGQGVPGGDGGGAQSTWGLAWYIAAAGGGGGYGGPGSSGICLGGAGAAKGFGGRGAPIDGWNWSGPPGGDGYLKNNGQTGPTGDIPGGGGAGGVRHPDGVLIQPQQRVPITVAPGGGTPGLGGRSPGWPGGGGMAAVRVRTATPATPAVLSGGVEIVADGYRYHIFTADGVITVTTPGWCEALAVAAGAGGGSGCGAGGGGADVRLATAILVSPTVDVTVGDGGAGGAAGAAGADGENSSLGALVVARGGGGGAGQGTAAGSQATGGGGHGVQGDPGEGAALRGYGGGEGGGYDLSAGGSAASAGGGGGAGGPGVEGAVLETQGDELAENWDVPTGYAVSVAGQFGDQSVNADRALLSKRISRGEQFVQGRVWMGHNDARVGIAARASHPSGVDAVPDGYWLWVSRGLLQARLSKPGADLAAVAALSAVLSTWHTLQLYVADGVQQGHFTAGDGTTARVAAADTTYDGADIRSAGARAYGGTAGAGRRRHDDVLVFRSKYLTVGSVPTGGKAQVLDADGATVAEAAETAGTALVDCSRFGTGTTGAPEPVPSGGWQTLRVLDAADALVAERTSGGVYPGGEYDVTDGELVVRVDESGAEPVPLIGLLLVEAFDGLTPGPEHGDGGPGRAIPAEWWAAISGTVAGDDGYFGGGGGGGAELFVAGEGGEGGGGAGAVGAAAPTAGVANTGGGGGGSGSAAVAGAAGGSGLVVVRTQL